MANVEFQDYSIQVKGAMEDAITAYLYEAAGEIEAQTARNSTPGKKYRGIEAKNLWEYVVNESKKEALVGSKHEAAFWEEFGTGEHALHGDGRKGWWVYVEGNDTPRANQKKYTKDEAIAIAESLEKKGLAAHATNGSEPNQPLFTAYNSLKSALEQRAEKITKGLD